MEETQVLELFRSSGAMLEGHFQLSSGNHADRYFQCALLLQEPERADVLANALAHSLTKRIELVVGPALGAVVWAHEMARALKCRGIFTERDGDGKMTLRRGFEVKPGEKVLVVEDVVTTGKSTREVVELLNERGAEVVGVGSILNRSGGNPFENLDLELTSLAEVKVHMWEPGECPLCKAGVPVVKPGSRPESGEPAPAGAPTS